MLLLSGPILEHATLLYISLHVKPVDSKLSNFVLGQLARIGGGHVQAGCSKCQRRRKG